MLWLFAVFPVSIFPAMTMKADLCWYFWARNCGRVICRNIPSHNRVFEFADLSSNTLSKTGAKNNPAACNLS